MMSLFLIAVVQSLLLTQALSQDGCKETSNVELTFYGYPDGKSDVTAFACGSRGNKAGGTGSYSDPESFATAQSNTNFKNCDIVYIPYFQKYFQYHDRCVKCDQDFSGGVTHLDLWIGQSTDGGLSCEQSFGAIHDQTIIHSPPPDLPVNSVALWDGSACHDASSPTPAVYPNPSTAGLCSSGSSPGGGSSSVFESTLPIATSISSTILRLSDVPTSTPSSTPITQPTQTAVERLAQLPSSSSTSSSSITQVETPTTLLTSVVTPSSSGSVAPATSSLASNPSNTSDCASWGGCLGDPCETYNDCAGEWICMGAPKTCHDNLKG